MAQWFTMLLVYSILVSLTLPLYPHQLKYVLSAAYNPISHIERTYVNNISYESGSLDYVSIQSSYLPIVWTSVM